jgi:hypothetical protein
MGYHLFQIVFTFEEVRSSVVNQRVYSEQESES